MKFYRRHAKTKKKFDVRQRVAHAILNLQRWARQQFDDAVRDGAEEGEADVVSMQVASAWYYCTYHPDAENHLGLLSFPWVASDHLARIAKLPSPPPAPAGGAVSKLQSDIDPSPAVPEAKTSGSNAKLSQDAADNEPKVDPEVHTLQPLPGLIVASAAMIIKTAHVSNDN